MAAEWPIATWAVPVAGAEVTGDPDDGVPVTVTVCVSVVGGVTPVVWQTYPYDAPAAREFPGTGTDPAQSVAGNGRELLALMLVSGSAPVLVTTTRHHTSEPYTVADEAQSAPLSGWVGSQEGPTGSVHTCTTAESRVGRRRRDSRRPHEQRQQRQHEPGRKRQPYTWS